MKKKVISVLLLVVVMVFYVGCAVSAKTAGTSAAEETNLVFSPRGTYHKEGFGETYFVYRFDSPYEDLVVFQIGDSGYLVGKDSDDTDGTSYTFKCLKQLHQFVGLSDKYLLFITEDGLLALSFKEKTNVNIGESCYIYSSYNELSDEEKGDFIYPTSYEKVEQ